MSGDFYSYLNSHNLGKEQPQRKFVAVKSLEKTPVFSESSVNDFSKRWLAEQGFECGLAEESGFKPQNNAIIAVEGVSEEDKDRIGNMLQDLVDAIEERFGDDVAFTKSNEIPECEEELGADGIPTGTYKARISYDYQPYTDEMTEEEKSAKKLCDLVLLKGSGAI